MRSCVNDHVYLLSDLYSIPSVSSPRIGSGGMHTPAKIPPRRVFFANLKVLAQHFGKKYQAKRSPPSAVLAISVKHLGELTFRLCVQSAFEVRLRERKKIRTLNFLREKANNTIGFLLAEIFGLGGTCVTIPVTRSPAVKFLDDRSWGSFLLPPKMRMKTKKNNLTCPKSVQNAWRARAQNKANGLDIVKEFKDYRRTLAWTSGPSFPARSPSLSSLVTCFGALCSRPLATPEALIIVV